MQNSTGSGHREMVSGGDAPDGIALRADATGLDKCHSLDLVACRPEFPAPFRWLAGISALVKMEVASGGVNGQAVYPPHHT